MKFLTIEYKGVYHIRIRIGGILHKAGVSQSKSAKYSICISAYTHTCYIYIYIYIYINIDESF